MPDRPYTDAGRAHLPAVLHLGTCDNEREPDGVRCVADLYARDGDVQVKCPDCGAWQGVLSRPEWRTAVEARLPASARAAFELFRAAWSAETP